MAKEIKKLLRLGKTSYYETHLSIINCLLPVKMTAMEIKVLAAFMNLEGDIAQYRFGPSAKKLIMNQLKLSAAGLSNYIGALTKKGFLVKVGDMTKIYEILIPENKEQLYLLKLINIESNENNTQSTIEPERPTGNTVRAEITTT